MAELLPIINEQLNGIIWRIEIDGLSDTLFLEIRNTENREVSFASFDLRTGSINFKQLILTEKWLTGIEGAYDGVLLLHHFQSATSPVHKAIVAINGLNATTLWSNYTYGFDSLSVNGPIASNIQIQPKKLFLVDIKKGTTLRPYEPTLDTLLPNNITTPDVLPLSVLSTLITIEPYGNSIHYLEYNKFRIVSLHSYKDGLLKQHLYVLDDANIIYEDILNDDIQKLQPEAFIVYKNCLIYIKNRSQLKVLNL
ncbi:hypothetical protein GCM10027049_12950 [Mucilaginibacter puniceus]